MVYFSERNRSMNILSKRYGQNISMRDSNLLRLYATMKAMHDTGINQPEGRTNTKRRTEAQILPNDIIGNRFDF